MEEVINEAPSLLDHQYKVDILFGYFKHDSQEDLLQEMKEYMKMLNMHRRRLIVRIAAAMTRMQATLQHLDPFESVRPSSPSSTATEGEQALAEPEEDYEGDIVEAVQQETERKIQELYEQSDSLRYDLDSDDEVDRELILGYRLPKTGVSTERLGEIKERRRRIELIEETRAVHLELRQA